MDGTRRMQRSPIARASTRKPARSSTRSRTASKTSTEPPRVTSTVEAPKSSDAAELTPEPSEPLADAKPTPEASLPIGTPPARFTHSGHGSQTPVTPKPATSARLRSLLGMSTDVDFERVRDDAADELERLRGPEPAGSLTRKRARYEP